MCTPALSALLDHYPDAEFIFLTSAEGKRVLGNFSSRIKNFWVYDRKHPFPVFVYRRINRDILGARFQKKYCFESNEKYYRLVKGSSASIYRLKAGKKTARF
jgi:hypothetical protein